MRCVKPFIGRDAMYGCGQCIPCRLTRRRIWTHRLMLEALCHERSCFVTLTYADGDNSPWTLEPGDLQRWLKRLRKRYGRKIRYYAVGEYGDRTGRPHYHVALFGFPSCREYGLGGVGCECPACSGVRQAWGFGHVMVGALEMKSARYIAGYCMKKMTMRSDIRLGGRHPEFARMSLRPGIGADAMSRVALAVKQSRWLEGHADVPNVLEHGKLSYPLGRYLMKRLRKELGRSELAPEKVVHEGLSVVRRFAWDNSRSVASVISEVNEPHERRMAAKLEIFRGNHEKI